MGVSEARYQTDLGLGLMPFKVDCKVKKRRYRFIAFMGYLGLIGLGAWMFRREMSSYMHGTRNKELRSVGAFLTYLL